MFNSNTVDSDTDNEEEIRKKIAAVPEELERIAPEDFVAGSSVPVSADCLA